MNAEQTEIIKRHLNMVFYHEIDKLYPKEEQEILNELHSEKKPKIGVTENGTPIHPDNFLRPRC